MALELRKIHVLTWIYLRFITTNSYYAVSQSFINVLCKVIKSNVLQLFHIYPIWQASLRNYTHIHFLSWLLFIQIIQIKWILFLWKIWRGRYFYNSCSHSHCDLIIIPHGSMIGIALVYTYLLLGLLKKYVEYYLTINGISNERGMRRVESLPVSFLNNYLGIYWR